MTPAALARMGFDTITRRSNGGLTAVYRDHLYTFDAKGTLLSTAPIAEITITSLADIFEAKGDLWNARNEQVHAQGDRRSEFVEGYDEPTGGPRARIRKPEIEYERRPLDGTARRRAEATRRALASIKF